MSSLKYRLDLGSTYNSRYIDIYICKMFFGFCMFRYLLKSIEVPMPGGSCGVSQVNILRADVTCAAEVPVSPPGH